MKVVKNIVFVFCFFLISNFLSAQSCDSNYFSFLYNATDFLTFSKALVTPDNNVICLQTNRLYQHGLTKLTPQGNPIFSYQYNAPFAANGYHSWTDLFFTDMALASDGTTYISGSVTKHGVFSDNTETPPARTAGVIIKADKYGSTIWRRFFANSTTDPFAFSNVIVLANGDIVGYLTTQIANPFYGRVACLAPDGMVKWFVTLNTGNFGSGNLAPSNKRSMFQTKNGNIVIGDVVYKYIPDTARRGEYHFFALNPTDGTVVWETSYDYLDPSIIPDVIGGSELPDGDLSFQSFTNLATSGSSAGLSKELNIITDSKGVIKNMTATYPATDYINIIDAKPDEIPGNQNLLLMTSDGKPLLAQIDKEGRLIRSIKYGKQDGGVPPACFTKINNGYDIFLSDFSRSFRMLRTDPVGNLDCDTLSIQLAQDAVPVFNGNANNITTTNTPAQFQSDYYTGFFVTANSTITSISRSTVCQKNIPCCVDVVDTMNVHNVAICEGGSYTLPDKSVIKDSGRYYVSLQTARGCDSVSLYQINVYKNPSALSLGLDTCFNGDDTIQLHATDGYDKYTWMSDQQTSSSYYTAKDTGVYTVNVTNVCGSKTDSVHVYSQCDFPIYVPNAFTPNGDRLNDVFRVPVFNLNRLIRFTIYNRWGKIVFQTSSVNQGWDGNVDGIPQQPGIYIYYLQMENLIGKPITQKGTFTLIR